MRKRAKNYLIPTEENDFKPHALQGVSVAVMGVLVVLTFALVNVQSFVWQGSEWLVSSVLPAVIVDLTNKERANEHVGTLQRSSLLDEAARLKAEDMATKGYFAHESPDGTTPWDWFDAVGYDFLSAGENLAVHFTDSSDVVQAWMDSPGHRENILQAAYIEIGVGTAKGEYEGYPTIFVVQMFGVPRAAFADTSATIESSEEPTRVISSSAPTVVLGDQTVNPASDEKVTPVPVVASEPTPVETIATGTETAIISDTDQAFSESEDTSAMNIEHTKAGLVQTREPSTVERLATQPSFWLQLIYGLLALFVVLALILSIVIEWRKQHPIQIAYGTGLLAAMALLLYMHAAVLSGTTIL